MLIEQIDLPTVCDILGRNWLGALKPLGICSSVRSLESWISGDNFPNKQVRFACKPLNGEPQPLKPPQYQAASVMKIRGLGLARYARLAAGEHGSRPYRLGATLCGESSLCI